MRHILAGISILFFALQMQAQQKVTVTVNGKIAGTVTAKGEGPTAVMKLKKMKAGSIKSVVINISEGYMKNNAYKKDLEVKLGDSIMVVLAEDTIKRGRFNITKSVSKLLASGKKIELTLYLNPANPLMMMPSRMVPLCYLVMK